MRDFHTYKLEAIVIRRRNFGEKDRILTLFSKEEGKLDVISKGCRRPGARLCSFSDIGLIGTFHLHKAKFLPIVNEVNPVYLPEGAHGEYNKTQKLEFAFKVIDKLFHESEPHQKSYKVLKRVVEDISDGNFQLLFLVFLANIIEDLGLKPELSNCIICRGEISPKEKLSFSQRGGIVHQNCLSEDCVKASSNEIKLLRLVFDAPFEKISRARITPRVFHRVYDIVKSYIKWHFGEILPERVL